MAEKLTPRVGDRVIFRDDQGVTQAGTVLGFPEKQVGPDEWHRMAEIGVAWDRDLRPAYAYESELTVVDREPVEWPRYPAWRYGDYSYIENRRITSGIWGFKPSAGGSITVINEAASAISADDARKIGEAWLKVAEHWEELVKQ